MTRWNVVVTVAREGAEDLVLRLDQSPITIGGSATSDIVLSGPHVSRTHATVTVSAGRLVYRDRSSNGSYVNGQRVDERVVQAGDVVTIPPYRLSFTLNVDEAQGTQPLPDLEIAHVVPATPVQAAATEAPAAAPFQMRLTKAPGDLQGRTYSFDAELVQQLPIIVGRAADAHMFWSCSPSRDDMPRWLR